MGQERVDYSLFTGERVDPSMLSFDFLVNGKQANYADHRHTPWGLWHTLKIHTSRYEFASRFIEGTSSKSTVLDVACGTGYGIASFKNSTWFGVDIEKPALDFGWKSNIQDGDSGQLVNSDATTLPFESNSFDMVTSFETMEHIPLVKVASYLSEVKRVLKPGGKYVMSVPNRDFESPQGALTDKPRNQYHHFEPNFKELDSMLSGSFSDIKYYYQTGRFLIPKNRYLNKGLKPFRVIKNQYSEVKPLGELNFIKETPSVYLAVANKQ